VADAKIDDSTLRAYCGANLPLQFMPAGFIRVEGLPRNNMGKIDRRALLDSLKRRSS